MNVKRVVEIGLLHTNGDAAECKRALCAMKTCSRKHVAPGFTLVPALRGRFRAFTLVEMLIVMIIMLIALGALIPAVTSLSKSNGRQAATSNLIGAIEQARAEAIKSGQPTTWCFQRLFEHRSYLVQRYSYHSYAIFEDDPLNQPRQTTQRLEEGTFAIGREVCASALRAMTRLLRSDTCVLSMLATSVTFPLLRPSTTASFQVLKFNATAELIHHPLINQNRIPTDPVRFGILKVL
jgi:prepilin-type N-terminal cleavage/methylation domain-containing protein